MSAWLTCSAFKLLGVKYLPIYLPIYKIKPVRLSEAF
jgi:hypothetical protein